MSLISFLRDAGEKLFSPKQPAASAPEAAKPDVAALNVEAANAITKYVESQGLKAEGLDVKFDGTTGTVTVAGVAPDQATKEKIVLCCGNVGHVAAVNDLLTVAQPTEPPATFHTVEKGDTLSKIAQKVYGNANAYNKIFEANRPMLTHPDKIYPGQVLRIPS